MSVALLPHGLVGIWGQLRERLSARRTPPNPETETADA